MRGGVFVLKDDSLVSMASAQFAAEVDFQNLLAKLPALLSGDQIDPTDPRKWVLVRREMALQAEQGGSDRWSLDHLFLDQDGIPTLVEIKRQTDSRLRREVVGQMLDYAANSIFWTVEGIQKDFEATCEQDGKSSMERLEELLGPGQDEGAFWQNVKTNLEAGRIRMLFVADAIPSELRRIIEFLNKQMDPAEVLGLELRQFEGQGLKTLVPLVVGQTEQAAVKRRGLSSPARAWDEETFFEDLARRRPQAEVAVARQIVDGFKRSCPKIGFGRGQQDGSMVPEYGRPGRPRFYPVCLYTFGRMEWQFQWMKGRPYFDSLENRRTLLDKLNTIKGVSISEDRLTKRPPIALDVFVRSPSEISRMLDILDWAVEKYLSA